MAQPGTSGKTEAKSDPLTNLAIDSERLLTRLHELGELGRTADGKLVRLAASDADKLGRDRFVAWAKAAGLVVKIDRIGNIFDSVCAKEDGLGKGGVAEILHQVKS